MIPVRNISVTNKEFGFKLQSIHDISWLMAFKIDMSATYMGQVYQYQCLVPLGFIVTVHSRFSTLV